MTTTGDAFRFENAADHLASAPMRRLLTKYVSSRVAPCDVDDVVQATLCDALASERAPREVQEMRRWLLTIARFKVADTHRAAARTCEFDLGEVMAADEPPVEEISLAHWAERQLPPSAE